LFNAKQTAQEERESTGKRNFLGSKLNVFAAGLPASKDAARDASRRVGGSLNMDVLYGAAAWRGPEPEPFN